MALREWVYTPEQAALIKAGDMDARNRFYEDNLEFIKALAYRYAEKKRFMGVVGYEVDNMVQQVYLDLPLFNFDAPQFLTVSIKKKSFYYSVYGGYSQLVGYGSHIVQQSAYKQNALLLVDQTAPVGGSPLLDFIRVAPCAEETFFDDGREECGERLKAALSEFLPPRCLKAFSFYLDGYGQAECARKLGVCEGTIMQLWRYAKLKLGRRCGEVLGVLERLGYSVEAWANVKPFDVKPSRRFADFTPAQREHNRQWQRQNYAKRKAAALALSAGR
jgi:hypothetical protein